MVIMKKQKKIKRQAPERTYDVKDAYEKLPKEVMIIAQEVKIVQNLACNDINKRNRQIRKLRKWLQLRTNSSFTFCEEDFLRIWKGLYYSMWMSDKPLIQEDLAEQLGKLIECFENDVKHSVNFFGAFLRTMCHQWFGIDQWRMDKFLMLVRRMLRFMLCSLKSVGWEAESINLFNAQMQQTVLANENSANGLTMHFLDIFCEELAKVADGSISAKEVGLFVQPFVSFIVKQHDFKLISHCRTRIFYHLLYQSSLGREYTEKYNAWKEMGFPTASINDLEKVENAFPDESLDVADQPLKQTQKHLDPRAGNVDVFMPELPLDAKPIIEELNRFIYKEECSTKCRKMLKKLLSTFLTYERGEFPLGVKTMPRISLKSEKPLMKDKIEQLENLENELYGTGRKLKQLNKRKRRKLLKMLSYENADEGNFDQMIEKALPKQYLKEKRKRAKGAMMAGWLEEDISDGELQKMSKTVVESKKQNSIYASESTADEPKAKKFKKTEPLVRTEAQENISKKLKATTKEENILKSFQATKPVTTEWDTPLGPCEIEYFIPSRKHQLNIANNDLVLNPLAKHTAKTPKHYRMSTPAVAITPRSPKRVKIALKNNTTQNPSEYIKQIKSSPNLPYDASKKPGKGLLKPNLLPSPINPFYKKKIGLKLLNDTF